MRTVSRDMDPEEAAIAYIYSINDSDKLRPIEAAVSEKRHMLNMEHRIGREGTS